MSDTLLCGKRMAGGWLVALAVAGLLALSGCGPADESVEEEEVDTEGWAGWPLGHNNITPNALRRITLADMPSSRLCGPGVQSNYCEVSAAWDGWQNAAYSGDRGQLIKALVRCALPQNFNVFVPGAGGGTFAGTWGFVDGFKTGGLTEAQQQILSGCVIALVNANNVDVEVAIIAPFSPELPQQSMPYMEAIYYGNLWWPWPPRIAAGGIQEDGGERVPGRNKRICGEAGNPCFIDAIGSGTGSYEPGIRGYCVQWAGTGDGKYCAVARDDGSYLWRYPSTVYLATEPSIVGGGLYRCGAGGNGYCQPEY